MRQRMHETFYGTADAGDTLSDSICRRHSKNQEMPRNSMGQLMQETLYQTGDAGDTLSDSGCRRHSI